MLSILIPTYNYYVFPLAQVIEKMALKEGIIFELICIDDGSFSKHNNDNQKINTLTNCRFIEERQNIGRSAIRQKLAQRAEYSWLLFIDADVIPKNEDFLNKYLLQIDQNLDAIFGGFAYQKKDPGPNKSLRYNYGVKREEVKAEFRNKNPFKVIISANYLIRKDFFIKINIDSFGNYYGMDYLFGGQLKKYSSNILHINNEVIHLGIDTNKEYLTKSKKAIETLYILDGQGKLEINSISILRVYRILNFLLLDKLFQTAINLFTNKIERNLTSASPKLLLFDLYRLAYLCRLKNNDSFESTIKKK